MIAITRKIIKQLVLVLCISLLPQVASAMEFGKLNVYSALGEALNVEIELLSASPEDLVNLTATLASEEQYKAQGINKTAIQQNIKANVIQKANGSAVVQLTSSEIVTDPFLDMLVQVSGGNGQFSREYTLLLDLPLNTEDLLQKPMIDSSNSISTKFSGADDQNSDLQNSSPQKALAQSKDFSDGQVIKTVKGDSLTAIAIRLKINDVNLDQVLLGIFKSNPSAFIDGDMNRLKAGEIIRLPSRETLSQISKDDASLLVRAQVKNWQAYSSKLADVVTYVEPSDHGGNNQNAGKLVTSANDQPLPSNDGPADVVKLAKVDGNQSSSTNPNGSDQSLANLEDDLAAKKNVIKETDEKSALLEKQISDMKHLLGVKNKALSSAQENAIAKSKFLSIKFSVMHLVILGLICVFVLAICLRRRSVRKIGINHRLLGSTVNDQPSVISAEKLTTVSTSVAKAIQDDVEVPKFIESDSLVESVPKALEVDLSGIDLRFEATPKSEVSEVIATPIPDAFNGDFSNLLKVDIKTQQREPKSSPAKSLHQVMEGESADVATKLELAVAYIDMADKKGARKLLTEALKEGGPKQRERAQALIDSLV